MYLTYQEYTNLGYSEVTELEFPRYEAKARSFLRYYTANKSDKGFEGVYTSEIKECMAELVGIFKAHDDAFKSFEKGLEMSRQGIASESVTDHSVSFREVSEEKTSELDKVCSKRAIGVIRQYLMWTGLLYRGI